MPNTKKTATSPVTVGNRYATEIKKRIADLEKTKSQKLSKAEAEVVVDPYAMASQSLAKTMGIAKRKVEVTSLDFSRYRSDSVARVNGVKIRFDAKDLVDSAAIRAEKQELERANDAIKAMRGDFCKEHELLSELLSAYGVNQFKTFVRARLDKLDVALDLTDRQFSSLVAEFIETKREHTCPL